MAVVSVNILHNGWGASEDVGKKTTFTVVYLVEVDDKNDGAIVVMDADDGTTRIPRRFETYAVGNDSDPFAFVKSKSPTPIDDKFWHVTVTFGPNEPSGAPEGDQKAGLDDNDQPTDDPEKEAADVTIQTVNATRVAERGAYIGQIDLPAGVENPWDPGHFSTDGFKPEKPKAVETAKGDALGRIKNGVPITNSVFTPFDPPPEISYNQIRITCAVNVRAWTNGIFGMVNTINAKPLFFVGSVAHGIKCAPYTCRFMGVNAAERIKNGKVFHRVELEFLIDPLFGWRLDILDRGYCVSSNKTVSEGAPTKNNIVDEKGNQIAEPVLLDGNGNMLDLEFHQASYLRYSVYPEIFNMHIITDFDKLKRRLRNL
jgi:hypothetical protein